MLMLCLRTLRYRKTSFIATFIALFLGSAIVMACGGLMETGIRVAVPAQRLAAAPIVVTGNQTYDGISLTERRRIDAALVDRVRQVPGVAQVIPDISVPAALLVAGKPVGSGQVYGHNWSAAALTPYTLATGAAPTEPGDIVLDSSLAAATHATVGATADTAVRGVPQHFRVAGVTAPTALNTPAIFFSDAETSRLARLGDQIDNIGVLPAADADKVTAAVRAAVGDAATVLTGDDRGRAEFPAAGGGQKTLTILAGIFGSWAVLIAMFGVASMLSLSLQQRQSETALLRAVGATPEQVQRMILIETVLLSVAATVLAIVPGYLLGRTIFEQLSGSGVVSTSISFHQGVVPSAIGAIIAFGAAVGATLVAARRTAKTKPTVALVEAEVQRRWLTRPRLLLAALFLAAGISMSVVTVAVMKDSPILASTAGPASVLVGIGFALLAPGIVSMLTRVIEWPLRTVSGLAGFLAVCNAKARNVRMAGAIAPIVLLVGIAVGTLYMQTTENTIKANAYAQNMLADYVLNSSTGGFAPDVVARVRNIKGVSGASELVTASGFVDGNSGGSDFTFRGVSADGAAKTVSFPQVAGSLANLRDNAVAISTSQASAFGVGVGDPLSIHLGDGAAVRATVVAIHAEIPNDASIFLPADLLAKHTADGLASQILVRGADRTDPTQLHHSLDSFADTVPGATVDNRQGLISNNSRVQQILVSANYTIVAMIVGYAAITVVNSLVSATRTRRREFGLQQLIGFTPKQVLTMLAVECGLISFIAIALGTIAAAATAVPYAWVKSGSFIPSGGIGIYLTVAAAAVVLTAGATLYPAARGMRHPPIETVVQPG
ncbi:ABC transporter permease [Nocardia sp. NPDC051570]|uniref:ABC transporter permease n=1 Tax=Nocardia sp. NPDC051570 TaxID=3364324 RepID=UPI003795F7B3